MLVWPGRDVYRCNGTTLVYMMLCIRCRNPCAAFKNMVSVLFDVAVQPLWLH